MAGLLAISITDLLINFVFSPNLDPIPAVGINTLSGKIILFYNHRQFLQRHEFQVC